MIDVYISIFMNITNIENVETGMTEKILVNRKDGYEKHLNS